MATNKGFITLLDNFQLDRYNLLSNDVKNEIKCSVDDLDEYDKNDILNIIEKYIILPQRLPEAMKIAASTIGLDLTQVKASSVFIDNRYDESAFKKTKNFNLKLDEETLNEYRTICEEYTLNMSARIREFIKADIISINENQAGKMWFKK